MSLNKIFPPYYKPYVDTSKNIFYCRFSRSDHDSKSGGSEKLLFTLWIFFSNHILVVIGSAVWETTLSSSSTQLWTTQMGHDYWFGFNSSSSSSGTPLGWFPGAGGKDFYPRAGYSPFSPWTISQVQHTRVPSNIYLQSKFTILSYRYACTTETSTYV